ncbi:MAG: PilN domain-containing protein [Pseudomonadota bacterium]
MSQQINLANPQLLHQRHAFGLRGMAIVAGVALAGALAWSVVADKRARDLALQADVREAQLAEAQQALEARQAEASRPASVLLTERVEALRTQIAQREALLASIGASLDAAPAGFAPRLRALSHSHVEGVWLNAFLLAPDTVVLKGSALQPALVTAYLDQLGRQPAFAGLRFSGLRATQPQTQPVPEGAATAAPPAARIDFELTAGKTAKPEAGDGA